MRLLLDKDYTKPSIDEELIEDLAVEPWVDPTKPVPTLTKQTSRQLFTLGRKSQSVRGRPAATEAVVINNSKTYVHG